MITWLENSPILFTSLISFFILVVLLGFGWIVRTRLKIRLGLSYVLFSIFVAIGLWLTLNHKYGLLKEVKLHTFIKWYTALVVFFAVWFLIKIFFVFDKQLSGLLVASSVTAGLLAFALQDFLSGIIAGIALNIEPPFQVGDWVQVGDKDGEVVDINWRATTIRGRDFNYRVIPNSIISKEQIINFYRPTRLHALLLYVGVEYGAPPNRVKEI